MDMKHEEIYNAFCKPSQDSMKADIKSILALLQDNGKRGLLTRTALIEQSILEIREKCSEVQKEKKASDADKCKKEVPANAFIGGLITNWKVIAVLFVFAGGFMAMLDDRKVTKEEIKQLIKDVKMEIQDEHPE